LGHKKKLNSYHFENLKSQKIAGLIDKFKAATVGHVLYIDRSMDYKNALNSSSLRQKEHAYLWEQILTDFPRLECCAMSWMLG